MDTPFAVTAPAKLYAFFLKIRPLQQGTLMPFSGELVHAAWLQWLRSAAPEVAAWLHEGNKRRLFTSTCKYALRGPDEPTTEESPLTVRQQLILLSQLAFYTGVGYKTAMGRTRPI